jgi:DNA polymerase I-like protein with 3'-5' exonuclease and polymerase domains
MDVRFIGPDRQFSKFSSATIEECVEYCASKRILGVDTETEGFSFITKKMIMFQIGDMDRQYVIDTRFQSIEPLRHVLESKDIVKVFHNAKFDYKFIRAVGICTENVWDTFLVERVIHCGKDNIRFGLAHVVKRYLNKTLSKDVRNQFVGLTGQPFTDSQILYGAKDVVYLLSIVEHQKGKLDEYGLNEVAQLENDAVLAFSDIEFEGLYIDQQEWLKISSEVEVDMRKVEKDMDDVILNDKRFEPFVAKYVQGDLFTTFEDLRKVDVKWSSPKQVLEVFQVLIPELEKVDAKILYKYRKKHDLIPAYMKYKEQAKIVSAYGKAFLENVHPDYKIHTDFTQILNTGRVSSKAPNMQQMPASNRFRNCIKAPEGWVFVSSDYSSQELNVIAYGSQDPVWLEALKESQDLHSVCAALVYGDKWTNAAEDNCAYMKNKSKCNCPEHKSLRTKVKTVNFGLAYGMGPNKLADTIESSLGEAKELIEQYFKVFPNIGNFLTKLEKFGVKYGYARTYPPYNRRRWFSEWFKGIDAEPSLKGIVGTIGRASKNTPIQGASADMTKLALVLIRDFIRETNAPVKIVMTVHDQIDTVCSREYAETWKVKMTELMEEAAIKIIPNGLLKAETNISECWEK